MIKKKRQGEAHSPEEIRWLIRSFTNGSLPDYQMSAWAMAVWFRGMNDDEIACLTAEMRDSGRVFDFKYLAQPRIDKHSTGGVGDKTTLIIGPILAAAGVTVPMIAGRGLGHTGGTLDKLLSIPGFRVHLTREEFVSHVEKYRFAIMGQTEDICPADRKFYSLRDVTATVDSLPLICGSIMSKKLAEDLTGLVLDVKFGSGAFMKSVDDAVALARLLKSTGEKNNLPVVALITNMDEPLGHFSGNSVEVRECFDILSGGVCIENGVDFYSTTRELSLHLSGHMLHLANACPTAEAGYAMAAQLLESGRALEAFQNLLRYQGPSAIDKLPEARSSRMVLAPRAGIVDAINTEDLGLSLIELGAGRKHASDPIDSSAGLEHFVRIGQRVETGQPLFRIFADNDASFDDVEIRIRDAVAIAETRKSESLPLIVRVLA